MSRTQRLRSEILTFLSDVGEANTTAILDHIADRTWVCRFANHTKIRHQIMFLHPFDQFYRAIDGIAFLIAGNQQADRAVDLIESMFVIFKFMSNLFK